MVILEWFKRKIKGIHILYRLFVSVNGFWGQRRRKRAYRKHGIEALQRFVKCMDDNGYKYTLAFGTMLGAIREHGFIKHDLDVDTFVWFEDFSSEMLMKLAEEGFSLYRSISIESDRFGREDTIIYKGVHIDIFYLYPAIDKYPYCCDFVPLPNKKRLPRRIEIPISEDRKLVKFENIDVYVPANAEEICQFRYGPNYMIPNPNWHWKSSYNAIREWPEMIEKTSIVINHRNV